jgi:hypothetical protein
MRYLPHWPWCAIILLGTGPSVLAWSGVAEGIEYQQFVLPDPNRVYVARLERDNPACLIASSIGRGTYLGGTETIPDQADRYDGAINYWHEDWGRRNDVIVAINGDFVEPGTTIPASGQVQDGGFCHAFSSSGFRWTLDREAFITGGTSATYQATDLTSGYTQQVNGVNRGRASNELIIYTPQYDDNTNTDSAGAEVLVELGRPLLLASPSDPVYGTVADVRPAAGSTPIPFDHVVLSGSGSAATALVNGVAVGDRIALNLGGVSSWRRAYAGIGGGEVFLINGTLTGQQVERHPRTAIGLNETYVFFVVVDGRAPGVSIGMNMQELGIFCRDMLQATYGINLDGGGSSTFVLDGTVVNNPSDGSPRSVVNGMLMVTTAPKMQATMFEAGDHVRTTTSTSVRLGPGTNYPVLTSVPSNREGVVMNHHLRGIYAKGYYWWKCDLGTTTGWVAGSLLQLVSAGDAPQIVQHPTDHQVCLGSPATFAVSAAGAQPLSFQWLRNGVSLTESAHYSGTATNTLTIADVTSSDQASYRCLVTGPTGSTTSYSAALLPPLPVTVVTQQPASRDLPPAPVGSDVTFTTAATGEPPLSFQWQKDGEDLVESPHCTGVTTTTLTIHDVHQFDDGVYRCRVTGPCGVVLTSETTLKTATPDFDGDGDVDQKDYGHLQACYSGYTVPQNDPACLDARLDQDEDVDSGDLAIFRMCMTGSGLPGDPYCAD